jgi:predicted glycogen debranching enzyme
MKPPSITLNREMLSKFEDAIQKEWLVTNGLGGYASSTVLGVNTRKYHGLLIAAVQPPRDRRVFLTKLDEDIGIDDTVYRLGANEFQTGFFPQGYSFLTEFQVSPFPKYVYSVQNVEVQKKVFMPYGKNAVIVFYDVLNDNGSPVRIQIFPIINGRQFHSVTDRSKTPVEFVQTQDSSKAGMTLSLPQPVFMMSATSGHYLVGGKWIERVYLREEARRGETCFDDCYLPGHFEVDVKAGERERFAVTAVTGQSEDEARKALVHLPSTVNDLQALYEREMERYDGLLAKFYNSHKTVPVRDWLSWLVLASDSFVVAGADDEQKAVIAGYHWFEAWGRDTFVSLPGLLLVTGRFEDARKIFLSFMKYCKQGLIPNFLPEQDQEPVYNTVDATMWFINAVLQYLEYTGDFGFVREQLWETLKTIIENHVEGTSFDIHVDVDGLLSHGAQLTWVDATVDGKPVNPRAGKAVEVQALWYNSLRTLELLANRFNERTEAEKYSQMAEKAGGSFAEKFWNEEKNCLFDVVGDLGHDSSLMPNQILASALNFTMLDNARNTRIVETVEHGLLTPCGLRTRERNSAGYIGTYVGDRRSRDRAYHNGTVWPWLLGPFTTAFLKAKGYTESNREYALKNVLMPFLGKQVFEAGLGTLNEIFDGDPPYTPRGCIAQAWSVAEPLRAYVEDVMQVRPRYEKEVLQSSR